MSQRVAAKNDGHGSRHRSNAYQTIRVGHNKLAVNHLTLPPPKNKVNVISSCSFILLLFIYYLTLYRILVRQCCARRTDNELSLFENVKRNSLYVFRIKADDV